METLGGVKPGVGLGPYHVSPYWYPFHNSQVRYFQIPDPRFTDVRTALLIYFTSFPRTELEARSKVPSRHLRTTSEEAPGLPRAHG